MINKFSETNVTQQIVFVKPLLHFVLSFRNTKPLLLQNKSNKMERDNDNKEINVEKLLKGKKEESAALRKMLEKLIEKNKNKK